jgi:hypothetical protein
VSLRTGEEAQEAGGKCFLFSVGEVHYLAHIWMSGTKNKSGV